MHEKNWKSVIEVVGVSSIVASLLFVGYQLRQDREIAAAAAFQARAFSTSEVLGQLAANENAVRGKVKALFSIDPDKPMPMGTVPKRLESLTAKEYFSAGTHTLAIWSLWDNSHYQYTLGFLPETHWQRIRRDIKSNYRNDPFTSHSLNFYNTRPEFQAEIDTIVEELNVEASEN